MQNQYGLDVAYFRKNLKVILRDIDRYTPAEMQLALKRLSDVAATKNLAEEKEAAIDIACAEALEDIHRYGSG